MRMSNLSILKVKPNQQDKKPENVDRHATGRFSNITANYVFSKSYQKYKFVPTMSIYICFKIYNPKYFVFTHLFLYPRLIPAARTSTFAVFISFKFVIRYFSLYKPLLMKTQCYNFLLS